MDFIGTILREALKGTFRLVGISLVWATIAIPHQAFGALTPAMASAQPEVVPLSIDQPGIKTWPAFTSVNARNVCVRVINSGTQDMTVWLLYSQDVVGLFTVLPQHISAMCSMADKIELGCSGDSCESKWSVFDAP